MFQDHVTAIFIILYRLIYVETRLGIITFNKQYPCICIEIGGIVRLGFHCCLLYTSDAADEL